MSDKISVIVPVYNLEAYIERTVASIQAQTYQNLEIILVDDGSKDNSLELLKKMEKADSRIKVISQENAGVTRARLTGVEAAAGEWIGFVDGDDYIEPDMYERLLKNAVDSKADISHCGYQMVFPSRVDYYYNTGLRAEHDKITGLQEMLSGARIEPGLWNKIFRKTLFHDGKMDFSIKNMEDLLMNFYLFKEAEKSVYEDFCPYHYMVREGSAATSKVNENKLRDPLLVLKTIKAETKEYPELQKAVDARIVANLINLATMPINSSKELILPYRNKARKELRGVLPDVIRGECSKCQKLQTVWAVIWPWSYMVVHKVYAHLRGTDRKYSVR